MPNTEIHTGNILSQNRKKGINPSGIFTGITARNTGLKNKDRLKAENATYRANSKEKESKRKKRWNTANAVKLTTQRKARYAKDPKGECARSAAYAKANPEKYREYARRRRAIIRGISVADSDLIAKWEGSWKKKRRVPCYWCSKQFAPKKCHVDHIIPISKDGPHQIGNLCIACAKCNQSKSAEEFEKWNARIPAPTLF